MNRIKIGKSLIIVFVLSLYHAPIALSETSPLTTSSEKPASATPQAAVPAAKNRRILINEAAKHKGSYTLTGILLDEISEFNIRKDEVVMQAALHLTFTPSPALLPTLSQLKIYLNEELVATIPITPEQLGKPNTLTIPMDGRFIRDFNKLRLNFIGHYKQICENPANSTLWLDISNTSFIELEIQPLPLQNNLSYLPRPFFDPADPEPVRLAFIFSEQPSLEQQKAAFIMASWLGTQIQWRKQNFSALINQLSLDNAIVLATNKNHPSFLQNYQSVNAPTIEILAHPNDPAKKLLLISGRDDQDLITAVTGLAQGKLLLRGNKATIAKTITLTARQPYDAPNWIHSDRPTAFAEIQQYSDQLESSGVKPYPVSLTFHMPPDLFLEHTLGIPIHLKYRYSPPSAGTQASHLSILANHHFIVSYPLFTRQKTLLKPNARGMLEEQKDFYLKALDLSANNQLMFDFDYVLEIGGGTADGQCVTHTMVTNYATVDGNSTLDLSQFHHYIAMPNLKVFMQGGFPFSRLADLSQTTVFMQSPIHINMLSLLLNVAAHIGGQTGYPAFNVAFASQWTDIQNQDKDILWIGSLPQNIADAKIRNILINDTQAWIKKPLWQALLPILPVSPQDALPDIQIMVGSQEPLAALVGMQSPFYAQRSILALLANQPQQYQLINQIFTEKSPFDQIYGSVAVIKPEQIVHSLNVGPQYYVGHLPWQTRLWYFFDQSPAYSLLALIPAGLFLIWLIWQALYRLSRKRLNMGNKDKP